MLFCYLSQINLELKMDRRHVLVRCPHLMGKEAEAQGGRVR